MPRQTRGHRIPLYRPVGLWQPVGDPSHGWDVVTPLDDSRELHNTQQANGRGQLGCLRLSRRPPIAPEFPACVAPVACSPLIWSPGGRSPQPPALQARSDAPRETRQGSRRRWPSGLLWPLSPPAGRPRVSSAYIAVPDDRPAHVRRKTSRPRAHPPSAAGGRRSLCFAQRRRRVRQQDASRVFPATRMRWRRALRDCGDAHTECCVRVWCLIARPLGRDWVCV